MSFILILGILLVGVPIIGFAICGSIFLYYCVMEDAPPGLFGGIMLSVGTGLLLLVIYFGLTLTHHVAK